MRALWRNLAHATVAVVLLGGACGPEHTSPSGATSPARREELVGVTFLLTSSTGFQPVAGTTVRLSFQERELALSAGCNHLGGPYDIRDQRLIVDGLAATEIGCEADLHAQDEWLAEFITGRPRITRDGDQLTLTGATATLTLLDREVADPDQALAGAPWTIDSIIMDGAVGNYPSPRDPTLTFRADGSFEIDTTCNTGTGKYAVSRETLTLSDVEYTLQACSGPAAFVEAHVQKVIADGTMKFAIEARRLTIERGSVGVGALRKTQTDVAPDELTAAKLDGLRYLLEHSEGFTPLAGTKLSLSFEGNQLSFSGGCNGHSATFELRDGAVIVQGFASTLRGCAREVLHQDDWLAAFFTSQPRIAQDGDRVVFTGADATLTFLDRRLADPDQPLAGAPWIIDTYIDGDVAMSGRNPNGGTAPQMTFAVDGTVAVIATCNSATGRYAVQGGTITFVDLAYTERGCSDGLALEQHIQAVTANGSATFAIEARRLTILRGELGLSAMRQSAP